tara:strand:- start:584 stop:1243 length:660 start_codon:yes stop_codon:yes gene_type:complete
VSELNFNLKIKRVDKPFTQQQEFHAENFKQAAGFGDANAPRYLQYITDEVSIDGLWIEMGVCTGKSITKIANLAPEGKTVYGFDSFEGLPEEWNTGYHHFAKGTTFGTIRGDLPEVPDNVVLVKGLFEDTLPIFAEEHKDSIAFLHVDCDLYSSTKTTFDYLGDRIVTGTVIAFDEIYNLPNYREGEYKAFMEFLDEYEKSFEVVSFIFQGNQITVKII